MKLFWLTLYNFIVHAVLLGIRMASPFNIRVKNWLVVRRNWRQQLREKTQHHNKWIWFHASSAGEFEDGIEVLSVAKMLHADCKILCTFFSDSGYNQCRSNPLLDEVVYLPLDTRKNARDFLDILQPELVIFSRNDVWPNVACELQRRKIPSYLVAFLCTADSKFFRWPQRNLYRSVFNSFTAIGTQNETSAQLLQQNFGITTAKYAGNTRLDRIRSRAEKDFHDPMLAEFASGHFTITVGSALHADLEFVFSAMKLFPENTRWIIVQHRPHENERKHFSSDQAAHLVWSTRATVQSHHRVLWVDTVGILAEVYKYSQVAFVGGGFDSIGIHNVMEPVARGNFVSFGPNHRNYPEALALLNSGDGISISKPEAFHAFVLQNMNNPQRPRPSIPEQMTPPMDYVQLLRDGVKVQ